MNPFHDHFIINQSTKTIPRINNMNHIGTPSWMTLSPTRTMSDNIFALTQNSSMSHIKKFVFNKGYDVLLLHPKETL